MLRVESLPDHPLIKYGFNTLERATHADIKNSSNLVAARNALLQTIVEKEEMINHSRTMAWRTREPFSIHPWERNLFLFVLKNKSDLQKIIAESPWSVMGFYLALFPWNPDQTLDDIEFNRGHKTQVTENPRDLIFWKKIIDGMRANSVKHISLSSEVPVNDYSGSIPTPNTREVFQEAHDQDSSHLELFTIGQSSSSEDLIEVPFESTSINLQRVQSVGVVAAPEQPHDQCGLALCWRTSFSVHVLDSDNNIIFVEGASSSPCISFRACFIYGPHSKDARTRLWRAIVRHTRLSNCPFLVMGDFNLIRNANDKQGGSIRISQRIEEFQEFMFLAELFDIPSKVIIEQRTKVNQKARILELKLRNHEERCSHNLYAVSIKEDTAYPCPKLHSASTKRRSICRIQKKPYAVFKYKSWNILEYNNRGAYAKKPQYAVLNIFNTAYRLNSRLYKYRTLIRILEGPNTEKRH
ncbi:reverse transcriptase [Tanacetum coccineum]